LSIHCEIIAKFDGKGRPIGQMCGIKTVKSVRYREREVTGKGSGEKVMFMFFRKTSPTPGLNLLSVQAYFATVT